MFQCTNVPIYHHHHRRDYNHLHIMKSNDGYRIPSSYRNVGLYTADTGARVDEVLLDRVIGHASPVNSQRERYESSSRT